jgi:hypothetical protein
MIPDDPLMALFLAARAWANDTYPDMLPTELVIRFHTERSVRLLMPARAFDNGDQDGNECAPLTEAEEAVLRFLREQKEPMVAKEVRECLERQQEIYGQSTVERALARRAYCESCIVRATRSQHETKGINMKKKPGKKNAVGLCEQLGLQRLKTSRKPRSGLPILRLVGPRVDQPKKEA